MGLFRIYEQTKVNTKKKTKKNLLSMKTIKILCTLVAISLFAVTCTKDLGPDFGAVQNAVGTNDFKDFDVMYWDDTDLGTAITIPDVDSDRKNSSSDGVVKLSSHTHAPPRGIIFNWTNHKTHLPFMGYMKVDAKLFEKFESFTVTTQQSNIYRDFVITPGDNEPVNGYYLFYLPRVGTQTNPTSVNNVWLGSWEKPFVETCEYLDELLSKLNPFEDEELYDAIAARMEALGCKGGEPVCIWDYENDKCLEIEIPPVTDGDCEVYTYIVSRPVVGGKAFEVDPSRGYNGGGLYRPDIKTFWDGRVGYNAQWKADMTKDLPAGLEPTWIWNREDPWMNGESGAQQLIVASTFWIENLGNVRGNGSGGTGNAETEIFLRYACDNVAVVFVNGTYVSHTTNALHNRPVPTRDGFDRLCHTAFDGDKYAPIYYVNIKPFLKQGDNIIEILAANSSNCFNKCCEAKDAQKYDLVNNPAGIMFSAVIIEKMYDCEVDECEEFLTGEWPEIVNEFTSMGEEADFIYFYNMAIDYLESIEHELLHCVFKMNSSDRDCEFYGNLRADLIAAGTWAPATNRGHAWLQKRYNELDCAPKKGAEFGSVTATNPGNYLMVPNANGFWAAKLNRADLEEGVELVLLTGNRNNQQIRGTATVTLVNGNLVLDAGDLHSSVRFGMTAYSTLPSPSNGNIHSMDDFSHNNVSTIAAPDGSGDIFLYVHFSAYSLWVRKY
jgi:hypothetical protein